MRPALPLPNYLLKKYLLSCTERETVVLYMT